MEKKRIVNARTNLETMRFNTFYSFESKGYRIQGTANNYEMSTRDDEKRNGKCILNETRDEKQIVEIPKRKH